jgi:tRNA (mo5U34)-methyltransferase
MSYIDLVKQVKWYHVLDLGNGIITDGNFDLRGKVDEFGLPADLHGLQCLDVGSSSGFWAFEMEKRGGKVTATDISTESQDIFEDVVKDGFETTSSGIVSPGINGIYPFSSFHLAKKILKSKVKQVETNVYDLDARMHREFDLVFCGSLLMHLTDPYKAIRNLRSVTRGLCIISSCYISSKNEEPTMRFKLSPRSIWTPTVSCLREMMLAVGFRIVRFTFVDLYHKKQGLVVPHVIFHGEPR